MKDKSEIFNFVAQKAEEIEKFLGQKIYLDCEIYDENKERIISFLHNAK